jgi:hypothetical protein
MPRAGGRCDPLPPHLRYDPFDEPRVDQHLLHHVAGSLDIVRTEIEQRSEHGLPSG